jgi:hypothetical protein
MSEEQGLIEALALLAGTPQAAYVKQRLAALWQSEGPKAPEVCTVKGCCEKVADGRNTIVQCAPHYTGVAQENEATGGR